jgi:hypothetical protein
LSFIDRLIDMHYARDGGRELFFPCMRLTRGFVVNEDQKRSIDRVLKPAYYVQLAALLSSLAVNKVGYISMEVMWAAVVGSALLYFSTAFALAKIYVGISDATAKAESRLFEARADALVREHRQFRFFRWGRITVLILLGYMSYTYLSNVTSWSEVDYGFLSVALLGAILLVVPPSFFVKWRSRS